MAEEEPESASPDHYFSPRPRSLSQPRELRFLYRGEVLTFDVDRGVFGSHGLDPGTALLIECLDPAATDRILDLGCGWGAVGVAAAKAAPQGHVIMTDVNRRAVQLTRRNVRRNGLKNAEVRSGSLFAPVAAERFHLIATNPPYHVGRPTVLRLLEEAPAHLEENGRLLIVGKGSQGIRFYQEWLAVHWVGAVEVVVRGSGYRVLSARNGPATRAA